MKNNKPPQNNLVKYILFSWIAFILFTTSVWIFYSKDLPGQDHAQYLEASEILRQSLVDEGFVSFLFKTTTILPTKAPLIAILPIPLYVFFGSTVQVALFVNVLLILLFFIFFYKLVSLFFEENIALASVIVISTMPLFYGLTHYFLVEFGLMTIVVIWLFVLLKTKNLTNRKYLLILGLLTGFGMLMKFHFFIFVFGPAMVTLYWSWKINKNKLFNLRNILFFALPALVISLPWYLRNIMTVLWKAKRSVNPALLGDLYYGPAFSFNNLYRSALDFINYVISPYWFFILLILFILFIYKKKKININLVLCSWFFIPFTIFYLGPNKDYRLMLPLLPPFAILIAWLIEKTFKKKYLLGAIVLTLFPILIYLNTVVFDAKMISHKISFGPFKIADKSIGYVDTPRKDSFPISEIMTSLAILEPISKQKTVVLLSEDYELNINGLRYYIVLYKLPIRAITASYFPIGTNFQTISATLDQGDYLIVKVGGNSSLTGLNRLRDFILQNLDDNKWSEIPNGISLPDSGTIKIWQKIS